MINVFWLNLLLSLIIGSIWITLTTIAVERLGSKIGGFIGGLPSTVVVSLFFIGLDQTPQIASQATTAIPLSCGFNSLFLVVYALLAKRGLPIALTGSLLVWCILPGITVFLKVEDFAFSLIVYLVLLLSSYYTLERRLKLPSCGKVEIHYTPLHLAWRAIFSGLMVTFAVFMSKFGGPIFGGIFAVFPVVFISTLIITYKSGGVEFSRAITKPLMMTSMITIVIYSIAVRYFYLTFDLVLGTVISYVIAMIGAYFTYIFVQRKLI